MLISLRASFGFALICALLCLSLSTQTDAQSRAALPSYVIDTFGPAPDYADGPLPAQTAQALDDLVAISTDQSNWDPNDQAAFETLAASNDARIAWLLTDMMRFTWRQELNAALSQTAARILNLNLQSIRHRAEMIDHMIAWDIPAYPGYLPHKKAVFTRYVPAWEPLMQAGDIPWHLVSWGGVDIDARPYDTTDDICHCIPAIDNPTVNTVEQATWLTDDAIIFGISINGEHRAYPRRIMEVREMVNDTLGGRDIGIPYCTLCGAAQAYFTDQMPAGVQRPVLRTSGLLVRSNKVMFDVTTYSIFDTFKGHAVTGPLADKGIQLDQASVITTTWGDWRTAHPDTTVLTEDLALGRDYNLRETRDANGPIFPIGDVDPRLPVHEDIIGVTTATGQPVAFPRGASLLALRNGDQVSYENVSLVLEAGGIRAIDEAGADISSHQAFWFAWSQFYPETVVWGG